MAFKAEHNMKIAVIGCGSIGKRHIRNLLALGVHDIIAYDKDAKQLAAVETDTGIRALHSLPEIISRKPDAVLVCTPNSLHVPVAFKFAKIGSQLFIEKPLSHNLDGVDQLLAEVNEQKLITMVGCNFKFHPSFIKMKAILESGILGKILSARCQFGQYLPDWHPWEDYRTGYSARSDLGGGILLDSHEFDYMQWFLGDVSELFCFAGKVSNLEIDTEDTAEVLIKFQNGTIAGIHLDYTQRAYQRNYEFFGENGTLKWDFQERKVWLYLASENKWEVFEEPRNYNLNEMYTEEMKHFIESIMNEKETITDIFAGWRTLKLIMAAKASAEDGKMKKFGEVC
ncbi:MAG: Gfo/Idh/MocA family oxidoreductase [Desulfobacteraceae bacterium]|nr:Gfo/Idh/MocA family oxidoreductase [Desulfobacteraceae bacterium]